MSSVSQSDSRHDEKLVLDGIATSKALLEDVSRRVEKVKSALGYTPILATILVGSDPSSATYVRMKGNTCRKVGMESEAIALGESTTTEELLEVIAKLNANPRVRGILLQHPTPKQIDERACFDAIAREKDVDGVTSEGFGRMALGEKAYGSATPQGIMTLLHAYKIPLAGKHAVVVGRSAILGKPMSMMLLNANATVTICHSKTLNLQRHLKEADIVVGAVGIPGFIKADWIKDGAVVVDAGFHKIKVNGEDVGIGDVDPDAFNKACAYTPVPGGVGPMTIATLIAQTLESAELAASAARG